VSGTKSGSPPSSGGESSENMACVYMGSCEVRQPQGIDILNAAVEKLCSNKTRWVNANISIATSNIRITDAKSEKAISEHRVRYLCFLGIATDDRYVATICPPSRTTCTFITHANVRCLDRLTRLQHPSPADCSK
jgi:hypothetical protein